MGIVKMKYVTLLLVLAVVRGTDAATYVVGDSLGWTIPSGGAATYATWASKHTYNPGDILVFNFIAGVHDVATVTKAAFDSCSSTSPTSLLTISPANVTLTASGTHHFICTFSSHCSLGQKLTVNVTSTASPPASPPTAATPPPTSATTPPTAATSPPATSPTAVTSPPTAATSPPATSPTAVTSPPTSPTMSPTGASPTTPPTSNSPAPAPSPTTTAGGEPSTSPSPSPPSIATPPGTPTSPTVPSGNTTAPPPPSSASRGAVATLAMGLGLVLFMGVVC